MNTDEDQAIKWASYNYASQDKYGKKTVGIANYDLIYFNAESILYLNVFHHQNESPLVAINGVHLFTREMWQLMVTVAINGNCGN